MRPSDELSHIGSPRCSFASHSKGEHVKSTLLTLRRLAAMVVAVMALGIVGLAAHPAAFAENGKGNEHWVGADPN